MTKKTAVTTKDLAIEKLWRRGVLHWKLDSAQKDVYNLYKKSKQRKLVITAPRRMGKSYSLLIIAIEAALSDPGTIVRYACPTAFMAQRFIIPTMFDILKDCPSDLRPSYIRHDRSYTFKNGSSIQIEGTDEGNAERLRGQTSHLCIVDEAGFMDDLENLIKNILLPQTLTTRGKIIISSTPPVEPEHYYTTLVAEAKSNNSYLFKNIYDVLNSIKNDPPPMCNRLTLEAVEELKAEVGGELSDTWQREFMCKFIVNQERAVVPEFTQEKESVIVKEWPRPPRYDAYTSMDLGFVDKTGVLFAYYDFKNNKVVVEDELLLNGTEMTTEILANKIKDKESQLWVNPKTLEVQPVYIRISDDDLITLNDLNRLHGVLFIPTKKDEKATAINELRLKVHSEQLIINPRCKELIYQLHTATWTKNRKTFERTERGSHFDLVDCLVYLIRNIQYHRNPYPHDWGRIPGSVLYKGADVINSTADAIKSLFIKNNK